MSEPERDSASESRTFDLRWRKVGPVRRWIALIVGVPLLSLGAFMFVVLVLSLFEDFSLGNVYGAIVVLILCCGGGAVLIVIAIKGKSPERLKDVISTGPWF